MHPIPKSRLVDNKLCGYFFSSAYFVGKNGENVIRGPWTG